VTDQRYGARRGSGSLSPIGGGSGTMWRCPHRCRPGVPTNRACRRPGRWTAGGLGGLRRFLGRLGCAAAGPWGRPPVPPPESSAWRCCSSLRRRCRWCRWSAGSMTGSALASRYW